MSSDILYMQRCIELAQKGLGHVSPNPMVGCVIVLEGTIIGEGYHRKYGEAHAEVNAIKSVKDKELLKRATLYVNLEPCCHVGKTPPCTDMIIRYQIPHVVIGCIDKYAEVNGKGVRQMQEAGIQVETGMLEEESLWLNRRFFTYHEKKRPYIFLKWAKTLDGFMDIERTAENPLQSYWITNHALKIINHKWRTEEDAIMIGTNTAVNDNPQLTAREYSGRNPVRVVIDRQQRIPASHAVFNEEAATLLFTEKDLQRPNSECIVIDFTTPILPQMMQELHRRKILSVIIEGGRTLLQACIDHQLWDEAAIQTGDQYFHKGLPSPMLPNAPYLQQQEGSNTIDFYINKIK